MAPGSSIARPPGREQHEEVIDVDATVRVEVGRAAGSLRLLRGFVRENPPRALPVSYLKARLTPGARDRIVKALRVAGGDA